jgi:hypothetical protein
VVVSGLALIVGGEHLVAWVIAARKGQQAKYRF